MKHLMRVEERKQANIHEKIDGLHELLKQKRQEKAAMNYLGPADPISYAQSNANSTEPKK
jgi:hypothetical protein